MHKSDSCLQVDLPWAHELTGCGSEIDSDSNRQYTFFPPHPALAGPKKHSIETEDFFQVSWEMKRGENMEKEENIYGLIVKNFKTEIYLIEASIVCWKKKRNKPLKSLQVKIQKYVFIALVY